MSTPQILEQKEELFRLLVESVRDYAIFYLDPDGYVRSWNEGARRIKGYEADEIIGKYFLIFYSPQEAKRGKPTYMLRLAAEEGRAEEEGWRIRKDGSRFWADVVITALRDPSGNLVGFAKVTRDLTERRRAEEERTKLLELEHQARQEAEAALEKLKGIQSITEAALTHLTLDDLSTELLDRVAEVLAVESVSILLVDEERGNCLITRAAKGIEEQVERSVAIPIGKGFAGRIAAERRAIVLDDVQQADLPDPTLKEKGIQSLMGVPLVVQGQLIGVMQVGTYYSRRFSQEETEFLQIAGDRAAQAIAHARLYAAAQAARTEADEAGAEVRLRVEFLSVAAHELRTPITSLRGYVQLLLRYLDQGKDIDPARYRRSLETIHRQSEKLTRLVTQLLETSRLEAGRLELQRTDEDLTALVGQVVEQMQQQTQRHEIRFNGPPKMMAWVNALRLEQALVNLLDNAIKYSPNGGLIEVEITLPSPDWVRISVRDHGLGIPQEQQEFIFDRFYQAHTSSYRSGLGLGLYLSQQIVERHGGRIWFEVPTNGGSRFNLELPTTATSDAEAPLPS